MKIHIVLAFIFLSSLSALSQSKEICITLDDLPAVSYDFKDIEFQASLVNKLIRTFNAYQIPAIGFVNERKLYTNGVIVGEKVDLLKTWLAAGYELGNHTYAHKDYHKVSFEVFTKKNGLPDQVIYAILPDSEENLWVSTNEGLCRFNPETGQSRTFSISDGLQSNEFNSYAAFESQNGELFFGGIAGYSSFFPGQIVKDKSLICINVK